MTLNFDHIKKRAESGYAECGSDTASLYAAMADVQTLLAEVEWLQAQRAIDNSELARVYDMGWDKATAAVVVWLRDETPYLDTCCKRVVLDLAGDIERGEHRKEKP